VQIEDKARVDSELLQYEEQNAVLSLFGRLAGL